ncbi:hypothetical protein Tco_1518262 [Tanacetum coccineum]
MDAFLKLRVWSNDPIPDSQRPPLCTTPPLEADQLVPKKSLAQRNLEKPNPKIINQKPVNSGSEKTISPTPLYHAALTNVGETTTAVPNDTAGNATNFEKEVVDLSAHSFHSTHHEDTKEDVADQEFWGSLSNVEVVRCVYQSLGQCVLSQGELLKRHEQLNHDYVDMCNRSDANLVELDRLRTDLQKEMQANNGLSKKFTLLDSVHSTCSERERELMDGLKDMDKERDDGRQTTSEQVERIRSLEEILEPKSK